VKDPDPTRLTDRLLFRNDALWHDTGRPVADLRTMSYIETDHPEALRPYLGTAPAPRSGESVTIARDDPQRVELVATLEAPGLVILADAFAPGWSLTIDGRPAPILRANRMMRGAAVPKGQHRLVYRYDPASFRIGIGVSSLALVAAVCLGLWTRR
jgi:hypothetical protein